MTAALRAVIERLEAATHGSRELDCLVASEVGWLRVPPSEAKSKYGRFKKHGFWMAPGDHENGKPVFCQLHGTEMHRDPPHYTTSIDAALTLVPEGNRNVEITFYCEGKRSAGGPGKWQARVGIETWLEDPDYEGPEGIAEADTPALALTLASLRARLA